MLLLPLPLLPVVPASDGEHCQRRQHDDASDSTAQDGAQDSAGPCRRDGRFRLLLRSVNYSAYGVVSLFTLPLFGLGKEQNVLSGTM